MLTQQEADALLEALKVLKNTEEAFPFPNPGEYRTLDLASVDGRHTFLVDVNRKGYLNSAKRYVYQGRYRRDTILLRLDIEGPEHTNPDGTRVSGNHLHIYREGYNDKIAIELPPEIPDPGNLYQTLIDFLVYFKTANAGELTIQEAMV